jgi:branched-subunit amino acid transport protein
VSTHTIILVIIVLGVGTYALRLLGAILRERGSLPEPLARLLPLGAAALLMALVATAALTDAGHVAGVARPVGVLAGAVAAWRRLPFLAVVVIAAATAAGLRVLGLP